MMFAGKKISPQLPFNYNRRKL